MQIVGVDGIKRIEKFGVVYPDFHELFDCFLEIQLIVVSVSQSLAVEKMSHFIVDDYLFKSWIFLKDLELFLF